MRTFSVAERRNRLAHRHFLAPREGATPIVDIAAALIGMHASDPATPYLSLWARSDGFATTDLDLALYQDRSLVKHMAMRRTLWLIDAGGLATVQAGASDRVAENESRRLISDVAKAGVAADGARWLDRAGAAVRQHLSRQGPANSAALRASLPELAGSYDPAPGKSYGGSTPLAPRVLTVLSARGEIMRGPNDGGWTVSRPRWAATGDWLGTVGDPVAADAARTELTRAWLRAFGPATVEDITWWFGSTKTAVRKALRDIDAVDVDLHGTPGCALPDDLEPEPEAAPWGALLPGLDVTPMGWYHRGWFLGEHRDQVFDRTGNIGPTVWWNGQVIGGWYQDADARVQLQLLEDPGRDAERELRRRADDLTDWLDGVRISPRFPSPLSKAAAR